MTCHRFIRFGDSSPKQGRGVVCAFRRVHTVYESACFKLHDLEAGASSLVTDLDTPDAKPQPSGRELMETGLALTLAEQPSAKIVTYKKVP
ncbi:MAG: hypothetical protein AAB380_04550 [Verrucomicrobiota bacterium]